MGPATADTSNLTAITGATSLSRLADQVVTLVIRYEDSGSLDSQDQSVLAITIEWLDKLVQLVEDPLDLQRSLNDLEQIPLLNSFGSVSLGDGLKSLLAREAPEGSDTGAAAFRWLRDLVNTLKVGKASSKQLETIQRVFEGLASALLTKANELLESKPGVAWTTASGF